MKQKRIYIILFVVISKPMLKLEAIEHKVDLLSNISAITKKKAHALRGSSTPYISGDSFRSLADHLFDETSDIFDPKAVKLGDVIFVKTDYLDLFFKEKHPLIMNKYILITHNSDFGVLSKYEPILADEKIIVWFGQNAAIKNNKKFIPIPIGIANQCWSHGNVTIFNKVSDDLKRNKIQKKHLLGINFRSGTNASIRQPIYDYFIKKDFCTNIETKNHEEYLKKMAQAKFILSPAGNGLDCHRTWEALLVGAVPIIENSTLDELFVDLPVLIINNWQDITREYLEKKYIEMQQKEYDYNKIYFEFWKTLINSYKKQLIMKGKYFNEKYT